MNEPQAVPDPTMEAIQTAVEVGRAGRPEHARDRLLNIWDEIGPGGDALHRCTLAHYLADLYEDPACSLIWDIRALDAADALSDGRAQQHHESLQVAGFYPSLHLNLADDLRRLGTFETADEQIVQARQRVDDLPHGPYGDTIRAAITGVKDAIDRRDTAPRDTAPGPLG